MQGKSDANNDWSMDREEGGGGRRMMKFSKKSL